MTIRFGEEIDRPKLERRQGHVGPFLRVGADHHDGNPVPLQEQGEDLQARHPRHLDIQGHDIGFHSSGQLEGLDAVACCADDHDLGRALEKVAQEFPHQSRVVDDQ